MNVRITKDIKETKIQFMDDVFSIMRDIYKRESRIGREQEHFWTIGLNGDSKVLFIELVSLGSIDESLVKPMQVFRIAVQKGAAYVLLIHNHPSQNVQPTPSDIDITDRMVQVGSILGIEVTDHLILTEDDYYSFLYKGLMQKVRQSKKYVPGFIEADRIKNEALQIGEEKGLKKGQKEIARKMLQEKLPLDIISKCSGLTTKDIEKLKSELEDQ
jgi:DNA repair protein RadC